MKTKIVGLVLIGLICSFCSSSNSDPVSPTPTNTFEKSYLALGDSYTIGTSVPATDRYPEILVERLRERGQSYKAPRIIAANGWITSDLINALNIDNTQQNFDLVTLLIGVNNQFQGRSIEEYRTEFQELLKRALVFAANKNENVRVISIPDWGVSPFASSRDRSKISEEIDMFNAVKKEETDKLNITFVDITEISRTALDNEIYFADDGLHFSKEMHELWVAEILQKSF